MLSYIAPALLYAIIGGGIVAAFCRVGGDAQARDDAAHKRANADRRSLSGGAAKPLFHSTLIATGAQRDGE